MHKTLVSFLSGHALYFICVTIAPTFTYYQFSTIISFSLCFKHQAAIFTVCMYSLIDIVYVTVSFGFTTSFDGTKSSQSERNICQCLRRAQQNPSTLSHKKRTVSDMKVSTLPHLPSKTLEYPPRGEHTLTEDIPEQTAEQGKCIQGKGTNRKMKETA